MIATILQVVPSLYLTYPQTYPHTTYFTNLPSEFAENLLCGYVCELYGTGGKNARGVKYPSMAENGESAAPQPVTYLN